MYEEQDKPSLSEENAMRSDLVFGALTKWLEPLSIDHACREGNLQVLQPGYPSSGNSRLKYWFALVGRTQWEVRNASGQPRIQALRQAS